MIRSAQLERYWMPEGGLRGAVDLESGARAEGVESRATTRATLVSRNIPLTPNLRNSMPRDNFFHTGIPSDIFTRWATWRGCFQTGPGKCSLSDDESGFI